MIKKIEILGIQLDNYTVREATRKVEEYLNNTVMNTIESISMQMLVMAGEDEALKESIENLDLAIISEKEILKAEIGINPNNDGKVIRLAFPELNEERRKELVKQVKAISEDAKVSVRNIRREGMEDVKKAEMPEDEEKGMEKDIQDLVNEYNKKIEAILKEKEGELLTV